MKESDLDRTVRGKTGRRVRNHEPPEPVDPPKNPPPQVNTSTGGQHAATRGCGCALQD